MERARLALLIVAAGSLALWAQTGLPTGRELVVKAAADLDWKPSTELPPGAEYHLIREDPVTRGIQLVVRFPSGYSVGSHACDADETIVVIKGKLAVKAAGLERVLGPSGYAAIPAGVEHQFTVKGWGSCWYLLTTAGPFKIRK